MLVEVHHLRFDPFTILNRLANPDWEFANRGLMAFWTGFDLRLMLGDFHFHRWYVKYLTPLASLHFHFFQVRLAVTAALHPMYLHLIRSGYRLECVSRMSGLPAAFLATLLPQALGLLFQPIARRRLAAVATVLGDLIFQPLDAFSQLPKGLMEKLKDGFFALIICSTNFFIAWQAEWLHTLYFARLLCF
jgi:hypothetical protein